MRDLLTFTLFHAFRTTYTVYLDMARWLCTVYCKRQNPVTTVDGVERFDSGQSHLIADDESSRNRNVQYRLLSSLGFIFYSLPYSHLVM